MVERDTPGHPIANSLHRHIQHRRKLRTPTDDARGPVAQLVALALERGEQLLAAGRGVLVHLGGAIAADEVARRLTPHPWRSFTAPLRAPQADVLAHAGSYLLASDRDPQPYAGFAARADAAAIGRVHVETWQATYTGLLPDAMLVAMSDVRQSAWWSQLLADPGEARGVFVADDQEAGVVGFGSCGPVRDPPEGLDGREIKVGEVYTLYVEPDFQNLGLGRQLLAALFRQLKADPSRAVAVGAVKARLAAAHVKATKKAPPRV